MKFVLSDRRHIFIAIGLLVLSAYAKAQTAITIAIDLTQKSQTIQNFGSSGCWFSDPVGKYWADSVKTHMAELLFSKEFDRDGNPKGIGLSAWRFNIGAGTAEQGDSSGIKDPNRRVECFLNADGTYNWNKEQGYLWFVKKARDYGIENLIAFVNSPPVFFTQNKLGYKTIKDSHANLKPDSYAAYANFMATVLMHFDHQKIHFNYISPVNEPQWQWFDEYGKASQEGCPYTNKEIYKVVKALDNALTSRQSSAQILIPEAGMLNYLYSMPNSETGMQIQQFWQAGSPLYLGDIKHLSKFVAGHGYFTEVGEKNTVSVRKQVADTAKKYNVEYWQSEYSMLGDGFKEGSKDKRSAFDCALFLAKLIHHDLTDGNASAWQFWNSWEPGKADFNTRDYLLALNPAADFKSGTFTVTKSLWALGQYSRFIRPGMTRVNLPAIQDNEILASAFYGAKKLVIVIINNGSTGKQMALNLPAGKFAKKYKSYLTTATVGDNMKLYHGNNINSVINIRARAIYMLVANEK